MNEVPVVPTLSYGKIFLEQLNQFDRPVGGMRQVGWYSNPVIKFAKKKASIPNNENKGGGNAFSMTRIESGTFEITLYDLNPENLSLILNGSFEEVVTEVLTDFEVTCYKGRLNTLNGIIDRASPIVVKHGADTYAEDADYFVQEGGIYVPKEGVIAALDTGNGVPLQVSLSLKACTKFQINSRSDSAFAVRFETYNEATDDTPEIYDYYKLQLSGAEEIQPTAHGDKFAEIKLTGEFLPVSWRVKKKDDSAWGVMYRAKD